MKKIIPLLLMLFCCLAAHQSFATHAQGGDIIYSHVSGNTYRVFVRIYRDRSGTTAPANVSVRLRNLNVGCAIVSSVIALPLYPASFDSIGANLCTQVLQQFNGAPPFGSDIVTYSALITVPSESSRWQIDASVVNRPTTGNIVGSPNWEAYAIINHSTYTNPADPADIVQVRNSTINFGDPTISLAESKLNPLTFRACVGTPYEVEFNFNNPDGDILQFSLERAISTFNATGNTAENCAVFPLYKPVPSIGTNAPIVFGNTFVTVQPPFITNFSPTYPLPSIVRTSPIEKVTVGTTTFFAYTGRQDFGFNPTTGAMRFTPIIFTPFANEGGNLNRYVVPILCREFRIIHGIPVEVGSIRRDALIYIDNCSGVQPPPPVDPTFSDTSGSSFALDSLDDIYKVYVQTCQTTLTFFNFIDTSVGANPLLTVRQLLAVPPRYGNSVSISLTQIAGNEVLALLRLRGNPTLVGDSLDLLFEKKNDACPNPGTSFQRVRIFFERTNRLSAEGLQIGNEQDTLLCFGEQTTVRAIRLRPDSSEINPSSYEYVWDPAPGILPGQSLTDSLIRVAPASTTTYTVYMKNPFYDNPFGTPPLIDACVDTARQEVVVVYPVQPNFSMAYPVHPNGGKMTLPAPATVSFTNLTPDTGQVSSYLWTWKRISKDAASGQMVEEDLGEFSDSATGGPLVLGEAGTYIFRLSTLKNIGGVETCGASMTDTLVVPPLSFPNLITANGDGINDAFLIASEEGDYQVEFFNRWGMSVARYDEYKNEFKGEGLPAGTYYYLATPKENPEVTYKGWLQLMK